MKQSTYVAIGLILVIMLVLSLKGFNLKFAGVDDMALHVEGRYIKNALGETVIFRGVNKPTLDDDPDGIWMGNTMWDDQRVKTELDEMKKWGVNIIRCPLAVELTKYDIGPDSQHPASPYCAISAREALHRLIQFAAERDMYVILAGYSVRCYWAGQRQDSQPYPPYQESENAEEVIASVEDFVDWWRMMTREYGQYSNVLFEPWNEPRNNSGFNDWLNAFQQCVNAIREEGFTGIIVFNWQTCVYCNIYANEDDFPIGHAMYGYTLHDWLDTAVNSITDPLNNIIYDVHRYRSGGDSGILFVDPQLEEYWRDAYAYNYTQMKMAMEYMGYKWAVEELNVPLVVGEHGCDLAFTGEKLEHELIAFHNDLQIFSEWEIGYLAFCWREVGIYRLLTSATTFTPTESGEILKIWIYNGKLQDANMPHLHFASHHITQVNYAPTRLTFTTNVPTGEIAKIAVKGTGEKPKSVLINNAPYQPKASMSEFNATSGDCWYYDSARDLVWIKVTGSTIQIDWENPPPQTGGDEEEPPPTNGTPPENQTPGEQQPPSLTPPQGEIEFPTLTSEQIIIIVVVVGIAVVVVWRKRKKK